MLRKIAICLGLVTPNHAHSNVDEFRYCVNKLRKTINMRFEYKHKYLSNAKVPFPYPNMHMLYQTPEESLDNFEAFGINNYDESKDFIRNWFDLVTAYNSAHKSLPIKIKDK